MNPLQTTNYSLQTRNGFITLVSVLIAGVIATAIATSLILFGLGASRTAFSLEQSNQAKALTNACVEEALERIQSSVSFTGSDTLALGQGACDYTVTSQGGQNRTVISTGEVDAVVRRVRVIIDKITPSINIASWAEIADF